MNQKFSQFNKDYAKSMAFRDDTLLKRSTRRGVGSFLFGLLSILVLMAAFFTVKKPLLQHVQQKLNAVYASPEKTKPVVKHAKAKKIPHVNQEYGFYTILPNAEVKAVHHDAEEEKTTF